MNSLRKQLLTTVAAMPLALGVVAGAVGLSVATLGDMSQAYAASHSACNPCAAKKKACNPCNPCAAKKACNPCNPCAAKKACNPCNPCAAKKACNPCNPCAAKKACNPCNPCAAKKACNPCNPCAAKKACNPCNPCAAKKACNPCNPCAAKNACNPCNPCNPCAAGGGASATSCYVPRMKKAAACNPCAAKKAHACNPCNPCGAKKACNPCNPCAAKKACNPCNPCAAKKACNPCAAKKACNPCNPCAAKKACNPCAAKKTCNPCNPCAAKKNPCNPCGACNPCNPCAASAPEVKLSAAEMTALYDCLVPKMAKSYSSKGHWSANKWSKWASFGKVAYRSDTHGGRFVQNYSNKIGAKAYGKYDKTAKMPIGSTLAKPSFTVGKNGQAALGPLFIMEKMTRGWNKGTNDWRYAMIMPGGKLFGMTKGKNSKSQQFCQDCHEGAEDNDQMFFLPEEFRK